MLTMTTKNPATQRSASRRWRGFRLPATFGHAIDQEVAMPMSGFRVQPPWGESRLNAPILQNGPLRFY